MSDYSAASCAPQVPNMLPILHSAANACPSVPNTALDSLRTDLRDQAHMLHYLPYDKADFSNQNDEPDAVPLKLRYGQLKSSAKEHAFILFYPASSPTTPPGTKVFIYDSDDTLKEQIPAMNIGKFATPDAAFDGLVQQHKVLAVAKFYFMKRGVDLKFPVLISKTFKDSILTACISIKKTMDEAAVGTVPLGAKHRMVKSEQPRLLRGSTFPFRPHQHVKDARHKALSEELFGSDEEDGSASMDKTIMTEPMVVKFPTSYSQEIYQKLEESGMKTPGAEERLQADYIVDGSPCTVVGRIQAQTPQNISDPNIHTAAPKKQVPSNPPQHHQFFAPALDMTGHIPDTRARKSNIPTEPPEQQPTNLIAHLRQFKSSRADLRSRSAQHKKDAKSAAENRKALEAKKATLKKEEDTLVSIEAALKKQEVEMLNEKEQSQREARRLIEFMPQEVREWLEFVVEDEPERKRQKTG